VVLSGVASAQIRIDQAAAASPFGTAGYARDDISKGSGVTLRNGDPAGVKRSTWTLLGRPPTSSAVITNPTSAVATIVPDVHGVYRIRLEINQGGPGEVDIRTFHVRDPAGLALPAVSERGGEDNYAVSPGVYNDQGHAREMNERQLRSLDNRDEPDEITVNAGLVDKITIEWGLKMGILQCLEITSSASTDTTFGLYADAACTLEIARWANIDASTGWTWYTPVTCTGPFGVGLENNRIVLRITNNSASDTDYEVSYRIKAP
jgi:hypothetical protein